MPDAHDWNQGIIAEFRANEGRVGGPFEGAPMILVHHVGRTSGKQYTSPLVYLPGEGGGDERDRIFAEQVKRMPGFGDYAKQTEGIRTIPVLRLTRR